MSRFSAAELSRLRNVLPVRWVIEEVCGYECKEIEGYTRFVCPLCHEMQSSLHPTENLARCFRCKTNFNPIDFVIAARKVSFKEGVRLLMNYFSLARAC